MDGIDMNDFKEFDGDIWLGVYTKKVKIFMT